MQGMYSQGRGNDGCVRLPEGAQAGQVQAVSGHTFRTVDQVLRWAYEVEQYRGPKVANYAPITAASTSGEALTAIERLAQSACIQSRVERLCDEERTLVLALYSWSSRAQQSIDQLCHDSKKRIDTGPQALIEALVVRHVRQVRRVGSESLRTIALLHGVSLGAAQRREEKVRGWLGRLWLDVEGQLFRDWVSTGLIQE